MAFFPWKSLIIQLYPETSAYPVQRALPSSVQLSKYSSLKQTCGTVSFFNKKKREKAFQAIVNQRTFRNVTRVYFQIIRESFCCHFKFALSEMSEENKSRGCCTGKSWKQSNSSHQNFSLTVRFSTFSLIGRRYPTSQFLY